MADSVKLFRLKLMILVWEFMASSGWNDPLTGIVSDTFGKCVAEQMVYEHFYREKKLFFGINGKKKQQIRVISRYCTQSTGMWENIQWDQVLDKSAWDRQEE